MPHPSPLLPLCPVFLVWLSLNGGLTTGRPGHCCVKRIGGARSLRRLFHSRWQPKDKSEIASGVTRTKDEGFGLTKPLRSPYMRKYRLTSPKANGEDELVPETGNAVLSSQQTVLKNS